MREILFRGKRTDNDEWIKGYLHKTDGVGKGYRAFAIQVQDIDSYMCRPHSHEVQPKTVGQYTGLTDKNGKKIFEGDIVKVGYIEKRDFQGVKYDSEYELIEQIVYSEQNACFMLKIDCQGIPMYRHFSNNNELVEIKELEVIGNIHDNPELLEK